MQPVLEMRAAYDHFVRAIDCELGTGSEGSLGDEVLDCGGYVLGQLDKALGHQYRSFFDVCDFLGVAMREHVSELLKPFTPADIEKGIPSYYPEIKPRMMTLRDGIAKLRAKKDIGKESALLDTVEEYDGALDRLFEDLRLIEASVGSCVEFKNQREDLEARAFASEERAIKAEARAEESEKVASRRFVINTVVALLSIGVGVAVTLLVQGTG